MAAEKRVYVKFHSTEFDDIAPNLFQVVGFDGTEAISQPFRFDIDLISAEPDIKLDSLIGKAATLEISRDGVVRNVHGVISILEQADETQFDTYSYKAVLVPRMWLMSLSRQNQIHQEQSVQQIVEQEMTQGEFCGGMLKDDLEFRLADSYGIREYTVQYEETDLNFVSRLLEHEGIFYYFDHAQQRDRIIFCDENTKLDPLTPDNTVSYVPPSGLASFQGQAIHHFRLRQQQIAKKLLLKDYNYRKPDVNLQGDADTDELRSHGDSSAGSAELGYGRVCYYGDHFKDFPEGNKLAKIRAQSQLCQQQRASGSSDALMFEAGKLMAMEDHYNSEWDQDYLITQIRHRGGQALPGLTGSAVSGQAIAYQNDFEVIAAKVQFRPALNAVKPKLYGILTAKVDGPIDSDRAQIDAQGRYKLVMPFDISGSGEGKASRWVRKAESYGGQGTGMHFPLLKGSEVIWSCIGGDPDRPIITGVVPNPLNKSVVSAQNSTANIIKTPGNIVIEMQDGKGSGPKDNASDTSSEQQNTRVEDAARVSTVKPPPGQAHQSHFYDVPAIRGVKPLLTEQQNTPITDGEAKITEGENDKWMKIAVSNYNADAIDHKSFIRLGNSSTVKNETSEPGISVFTDDCYTQKSDAGYINISTGVSYSVSAAMKGEAVAAYNAKAVLGLDSEINVAGSIKANFGVDVETNWAAKTTFSKGLVHEEHKGKKFSQIDRGSENSSKYFLFTALNKSDDVDVDLLRAKRRTRKKELIVASAVTGTLFAAAMGTSGSKATKDSATGLLGGSLVTSVLTAVAALSAAQLTRKIAKEERKKQIDKTGFIAMDSNGITLSCDGSSILICKAGVFINGAAFVVGDLPKVEPEVEPLEYVKYNGEGTDKVVCFTNSGNTELNPLAINRKYPDHIILNARGTVDLRAKDKIELTSDNELTMADAPTEPPRDAVVVIKEAELGSGTKLSLNVKTGTKLGTGVFKIRAQNDVDVKSEKDIKFETVEGVFDASGKLTKLGNGTANIDTINTRIYS